MIRYVFQKVLRCRKNDGFAVVRTEKVRIGSPNGKVIFNDRDWRARQFSYSLDWSR